MALSKGFRIFEKKQPNHSIILEHRQRTHEALLFESQAVAVLCKSFFFTFLLTTYLVRLTSYICLFFAFIQVSFFYCGFNFAFCIFFWFIIPRHNNISILTTCYVTHKSVQRNIAPNRQIWMKHWTWRC